MESQDIILPKDVWYNCILMRCSLTDLIMIKRVCKTFARWNKLKELIAAKISRAFGYVGSARHLAVKYWNKPGNIGTRNVVTQNFFDMHSGQYLFASKLEYTHSKVFVNIVGVFSCEIRLRRLFDDRAKKFYLPEIVFEHYVVNDGLPNSRIHVRFRNNVTVNRSTLTDVYVGITDYANEYLQSLHAETDNNFQLK